MGSITTFLTYIHCKLEYSMYFFEDYPVWQNVLGEQQKKTHVWRQDRNGSQFFSAQTIVVHFLDKG